MSYYGVVFCMELSVISIRDQSLSKPWPLANDSLLISYGILGANSCIFVQCSDRLHLCLASVIERLSIINGVFYFYLLLEARRETCMYTDSCIAPETNSAPRLVDIPAVVDQAKIDECINLYMSWNWIVKKSSCDFWCNVRIYVYIQFVESIFTLDLHLIFTV